MGFYSSLFSKRDLSKIEIYENISYVRIFAAERAPPQTCKG